MNRSRLGWLFLAAFLALLIGPSGPVAAQESGGGDFNDTTPPESPTDVIVILEVNDISRIDEREGVTDVNGTLSYAWSDARIGRDCQSDDPDQVFQGESAREKLKSIWWPEFVFRNGIGPRETVSLAITVGCNLIEDAKSSVIYEERFRATIGQDFNNLNDFPFDKHVLAFTVMSSAQDYDSVRIQSFNDFVGDEAAEGSGKCGDSTGQSSDGANKEETTRKAGFCWATAEWKVVADDFAKPLIIDPTELVELPTSEDEFSPGVRKDENSYYGDPYFSLATATFKTTIERRSMFYIQNIILPLVLIVSISWAVFWGNRGKMTLAERLGISITSLLTVVAFDFLTGDSLPKLSYTTRLDAFYNFSYLFVAFTVLESLISVKRQRVDEDEGWPATKIDRVCRWLIPITYLVAVAISMAGWVSPGAPPSS